MKTFIETFIYGISTGVVSFVMFKDNSDNKYKKYVSRAKENFYDPITGNICLLCYVTGREEIIRSSNILQFSHPCDGVIHENAEITKKEYAEMVNLTGVFNDFDATFFNASTNLGKLKICRLLELSSISELNGSKETLLVIIELWKRKIQMSKLEVLKYLDNERENAVTQPDKDNVSDVMKMIENYDATSELEKISTKEELFQYWPTLLLPAPDFVNSIYKEVSRLT